MPEMAVCVKKNVVIKMLISVTLLYLLCCDTLCNRYKMMS